MTVIAKKILWPFLILLLGGLAMLAMAALKEEIPKHDQPLSVLQVRAMTAKPETLSVTLRGYGQAMAVNTVVIAPEVGGRLVYVNPDLEPGGILPKGSLLFEVDRTGFQLVCDELSAVQDRLENQIKSMEIQQSADRIRHKIAMENQALARAEFQRLSRLFDKEVGTRSQKDEAEQALNRARDLAEELSGTVRAFPFALAQARSRLAETRARLAAAREDLVRCRVYAPFDCRVKTAGIEAGQYVTPGQTAARLADDSILEIHVSLDSREARKWLRFDPREGALWFSGLDPVSCRVFWTEDAQERFLSARVHRVVAFNPDSRSLVVAVRLDRDRAGTGGFPIVEGMFCRVEIPGKTRENVFCIPGAALGGDDRVFLAEKGRATAVKVKVIHFQNQNFYTDAGIASGDKVILTPLPASADDAPINMIKGEDQ